MEESTDFRLIPRQTCGSTLSCPPPSWLRRVLDDETVEVLVLPTKTDEQRMAEIRRLFSGTTIAKGFKGGMLFDESS
jgi:hypothetical protein